MPSAVVVGHAKRHDDVSLFGKEPPMGHKGTFTHGKHVHHSYECVLHVRDKRPVCLLHHGDGIVRSGSRTVQQCSDAKHDMFMFRRNRSRRNHHFGHCVAFRNGQTRRVRDANVFGDPLPHAVPYPPRVEKGGTNNSLVVNM